MPRPPIGVRAPSRTVPAYDELLRPTLVALKAMGGSASNEELLGKLIELERIPERVASLFTQTTDNRNSRIISRGQRLTSSVSAQLRVVAAVFGRSRKPARP